MLEGEGVEVGAAFHGGTGIPVRVLTSNRILSSPIYMGIRASITEISPEELEDFLQGGNPGPSAKKWRSIDKCWYDYYLIAGIDGIPLKKAITGDGLHPLSPQTLDEFYNGGHEYYVGFSSPELVHKLSDTLSRVSRAELQQVFDNHERGFSKYDWECFKELTTAYSEAASSGNALMIVIS